MPPCAANDFSCALRGTLAWTVEPGAKLVPAKSSEGAADSALNSEKKFSATISLPTKSDLFDIAVAAATWFWRSRRNNLCLWFQFKRTFATRESFRSRQLATGPVRPTGGHARPRTQRAGSALPNPAFRFRQIGLIDFEPDKSFHAAALRCHG